MTTCTTSIATKELEVRYGKTVAVTDVNLDIPAGSLLSVIGPVSYTHLTLPTILLV